ncbi:hypothetical protein [Dendronalium sp. ChiSLP03b]|uniref:hypothetical protein n=1 Tax=Dendronalium sp. ChiSLP03b TaxID=3075381 RepID=UPI002AD558F6|nr:hypothetical protein [Dendronalium sp. ChiSLP03b]MDZ8202898.1 hypothetical protein [Dendronalium sp. ChiSLP03b]
MQKSHKTLPVCGLNDRSLTGHDIYDAAADAIRCCSKKMVGGEAHHMKSCYLNCQLSSTLGILMEPVDILKKSNFSYVKIQAIAQSTK